MDEREIFQGKSPEQGQLPQPESHRLLGGVKITMRETCARLSWNEYKTELRVNTSLYPNERTARFAALRQVATHIGLTQAVRTDANVLFDVSENYPGAMEPILRWQGLARLRQRGKQFLRDLPTAQQNHTLSSTPNGASIF